jgi:hypothetical protein
LAWWNKPSLMLEEPVLRIKIFAPGFTCVSRPMQAELYTRSWKSAKSIIVALKDWSCASVIMAKKKKNRF